MGNNRDRKNGWSLLRTKFLARGSNRQVILVENNTHFVHQADLLLIVTLEGCRGSVDLGEQSQYALCRDRPRFGGGGRRRCSHFVRLCDLLFSMRYLEGKEWIEGQIPQSTIKLSTAQRQAICRTVARLVVLPGVSLISGPTANCQPPTVTVGLTPVISRFQLSLCTYTRLHTRKLIFPARLWLVYGKIRVCILYYQINPF